MLDRWRHRPVPGLYGLIMSVRIKTIAAISFTLLGLLVILYFAYSHIVASNVASLEAESTVREVERVVDALNDEIAGLNATVGDWAPWDDTYQFVQDGNSDYTDSNLGSSTLSNLQLNLIAFTDTSGRLVYGTGFDLINETELPLSTGLSPYLQSGSDFLKMRPSDSLAGILILDEEPMLVAAQPIVKSDGSGPSQGTLVMGRRLDSAVVADLARRTHLTVDVFRYAAPNLPPDVASAKDELSSTAITITALNEEMVAGYTLLKDINGQSALLVRVESPRVVYAQSKTSGIYFMLALLISGLTFGLVTILSIERVVLSPVAKLNRSVQQIGKASNLAARVDVHGNDEISALAASVNSMLGSLEGSRLSERESQERYRAVIEQTAEAIFLLDTRTKHIFEANQASLSMLGYSLDEILSLTLYDVIVEAKDEVDSHLEAVLPEGQSFIGAHLYQRKDGSTLWAEVSATTISYGGQPVICIVARDITERRRAEEIRLLSERRFQALVENSADAITLFGTDGRVIYDSPAAPGLLGYEQDELVGQIAFNYIHPADMPEVLTLLGQIQENPNLKVSGILRFKHKGGAWRWLEATGHNLLAEPSVQAIVVNYRDVTDRVWAEQQVRQNAARAEALVRVAARLNAQLDLDRVLQAICEETAQALTTTAVSLSLYDDSRQTYLVAALHGLPTDFQERTELPLTDYSQFAVMAGQIVFYEDVQKLPGLKDTALYTAHNVRSLLIATLRRGEQVIGYLTTLTCDEPRKFRLDEMELLQGLADLAAHAITNARLYEKNLRQLDRLMVLNATARKLTQSHQFDELTMQVAQTCVDNFGVGWVWLGQVMSDGLVRTLAWAGSAPDLLFSIPVHWNDVSEKSGPVVRAIQSGSPVVIPDLTCDDSHIPWREAVLAHGFHSALALPLSARDQPFGAILLLNETPNTFAAEQIEFLMTYANQVAATLENARLYSETVRRLQSLRALSSIDMAIISSTDLRLTLSTILAEIINQLDIDAADILLYKADTLTLQYETGRGFRTEALRHTRLRLGQGYAGQAALERRLVAVPGPADLGGELSRSPQLAREDFQRYYGVPLIARGQIQGVLEVFRRSATQPDIEWLELLEALASQTAIAIDNATLLDGLQRANTELVVAYDATIEGWSHALDLRDKETEGHTRRVTDMTLRLAQVMGINDAELVHIRRGALLHDIGKMGIPDSILLKPSALTDEEWAVMRRHPEYAYEMLLPIVYLRPAIDIPYCHHEKWDGTGYPRGLQGEMIPLAARIFAVVDVWDALSYDRPYRQAWPTDKVYHFIREQVGKHFDPRVADLFLSLHLDADQSNSQNRLFRE